MKFLKKVFPLLTSPEPGTCRPGNKRLVELMHTWHGNNSVENYNAVIRELLFGDSFLFLPFLDVKKMQAEWETLQRDTLLKISSVFEHDGVKMLLAFTDEKLVTDWSKGTYTSMLSVNILNACEVHIVSKAIIYYGKSDPFLLEWEY